MQPKQRVACLTGGTRMGSVIATDLAKKGFHIAVSYNRSKKEAQSISRRVSQLHKKSLIIKANLIHEKDVTRLTQQIKTKFKRLDVLINMASVYKPTAIKNLDEKNWDFNMDANAKSAYLLTGAAKELLKKSKGRVINISDWVCASGRPRYKQFVPYYISKKAVIGITEALALELAPDILVNCIAPGPILPPKNLSNEETRNVKKVTPLQKWGGAKEISKAIQFLIDTSFVTGECIRVDGGRHLF